MSLINITGAVNGNKNRLEINDFIKNKKFLTLYVRALQTIQGRGERQADSFYQIAGVHGLPYKEWPSGKPGSRGYCTHGLVLFPTWHRVYVAFYEQTVQAAALNAAKRFTVDTDAWIQAAEDLRQPFWDWGSRLVPPSVIAEDPKVTITDYNGKDITVDNPIISFTLPEKISDDYGLKTYREPELFNGAGIKVDTWHTLRGSTGDWEDFSNHGVRSDDANHHAHAKSLEAVHDDMHDNVGGWMGDPSVAAFDPIFWLHHCNVDRYLSLWYAINPDTWVSEGKNLWHTEGITDDTLDKNTGLSPFRKDPRELWTSAMITDTAQLGYNYPDFDTIRGRDKDTIKKFIVDRIDKLYGLRPSNTGLNSDLDHLALFKGSFSKPLHHDAKIWDWNIRVTFKKYELKRRFKLVFYFANAPGGPREQFVGSVAVFRGSSEAECENCRLNANLVQESIVHLSYAVATASGVHGFEPDAVIPFFKNQKLSYKLVTTEENANLTTLNLKLYARQLTIPAGECEPVEGEILTFNDVIAQGA